MSKEKKKAQLGIDPGTASSRLNRMIMFSMICRLGINACHQCGEPMTVENFSVEHIVPWFDSGDPYKLFFDLSNISFSHLSCNRLASRSHNKGVFSTKHGTSQMYNYHKCRCAVCKEYKANQNKKRIR